MHPPVLREADGKQPLGARYAHVSEAALLFEPLIAVLVQRPLMREQPLLPAGQEHHVELQPLGAVQRHHAHAVAVARLVHVHHQRYVLQEGAEAVELAHEADQLFQVFETALRLRRLILLPHRGVAALVEDQLGEVGVRHGAGKVAPAGEILGERAQRFAGGGLQLLGFRNPARHRTG